MLTCPNCKALHVVKYGKTRSGYKCRECGRRFVEHPTKKYLSQETWAQIDDLLKEKLPLRRKKPVNKSHNYHVRNKN